MTHKTIIDRVSNIEDAFPRLVDSLSQHLDQRLNPVIQNLDAVLEILGRETVVSKITELREKRQSEESEAKKKQLEALLTEGKIVKTDKVSDKSIIVAQEKSLEGKVIHPGRFQLMFNEVAPVFQEKILAKEVGTVVDIPNYGTLEVQEIYEPVTQAAQVNS